MAVWARPFSLLEVRKILGGVSGVGPSCLKYIRDQSASRRSISPCSRNTSTDPGGSSPRENTVAQGSKCTIPVPRLVRPISSLGWTVGIIPYLKWFLYLEIKVLALETNTNGEVKVALSLGGPSLHETLPSYASPSIPRRIFARQKL